MINLETVSAQTAPIVHTPVHANLLLHCGAAAVTRMDLASVRTPSATTTWRPVAHLELLDSVERALHDAGHAVQHSAHALTHDGARYFGLLQVNGTNATGDVTFVVGVRNSHDKSLPAGLVAGSQVLVCDNLAFSGEIVLHRKHTARILDDLPGLARQAVEGVGRIWAHEAHRITAYKQKAVTRNQAHDLIIRALDAGVCTATQIPDIVTEWRTPRHKVFEERTLWSLHNAFTEILKGNLPALPVKTRRLNGLLDGVAGLHRMPAMAVAV